MVQLYSWYQGDCVQYFFRLFIPLPGEHSVIYLHFLVLVVLRLVDTVPLDFHELFQLSFEWSKFIHGMKVPDFINFLGFFVYCLWDELSIAALCM